MRRAVFGALVSAGLVLAVAPRPAEAAGCQFTLGFKLLHDDVPSTVGACVDDVTYNPVTGDALQQTTNGLLVWRKADNFTAFTNGSLTWINSAGGIVERPNTERFGWEANPDHLPVIGAAVTSFSASDVAAASAADQAALAYVTSTYPGSGTAQVLKTEPDVDRGVAVFDVRVLAPNGTIYVVHVDQSSNAVLWVNPAENQTPPSTGSTGAVSEDSSSGASAGDAVGSTDSTAPSQTAETSETEGTATTAEVPETADH